MSKKEKFSSLSLSFLARSIQIAPPTITERGSVSSDRTFYPSEPSGKRSYRISEGNDHRFFIAIHPKSRNVHTFCINEHFMKRSDRISNRNCDSRKQKGDRQISIALLQIYHRKTTPCCSRSPTAPILSGYVIRFYPAYY